MKEEEFELLGKVNRINVITDTISPYLEIFLMYPYVEAFVEGIRVNIVPCYDVEKWNWISGG